MWRDPLDELIEDLERIVPETAPPCQGFDPVAFQMSAELLDRQIEREGLQERRERQEAKDAEGPSAIATAPAVWLAPPARRRDPSAPIWVAAADSDADDIGD